LHGKNPIKIAEFLRKKSKFIKQINKRTHWWLRLDIVLGFSDLLTTFPEEGKWKHDMDNKEQHQKQKNKKINKIPISKFAKKYPVDITLKFIEYEKLIIASSILSPWKNTQTKTKQIKNETNEHTVDSFSTNELYANHPTIEPPRNFKMYP
jgi:hypothetical protein